MGISQFGLEARKPIHPTESHWFAPPTSSLKCPDELLFFFITFIRSIVISYKIKTIQFGCQEVFKNFIKSKIGNAHFYVKMNGEIYKYANQHYGNTEDNENIKALGIK